MERRSLERQLGRKPTERALSQAEVKVLVARLRDIVAVLHNADPELKRSIYDEVGVRLTYHPDGTVDVEAGEPRVLGVRVGGPRCTRCPHRCSGLSGPSRVDNESLPTTSKIPFREGRKRIDPSIPTQLVPY
jgi:hypothetical protein